MDAYIAYPDIKNAPVLIVIQEIFGVNQEIRDRCDHYAKNGFIAIAPDLFWRIEKGVDLTDQSQEEWDKAFDLYNKFDPDIGVRDLEIVLNYARTLEGSNGKIGNIGFCLGGLLSYLMATRTDVDASVNYYGVGLQDRLDEMKDIKAPTVIHIATKDEYTPRNAQAIIAQTSEHNAHISTYLYEGQDHAFARKGGAHFDQAATDLAHKRSFDVLNTLK